MNDVRISKNLKLLLKRNKEPLNVKSLLSIYFKEKARVKRLEGRILSFYIFMLAINKESLFIT